VKSEDILSMPPIKIGYTTVDLTVAGASLFMATNSHTAGDCGLRQLSQWNSK
jgi:hypothetical protein